MAQLLHYCVHFLSPPALHFLLRLFSPGSRSCCVNLFAVSLSLIFFVLVLSGFSFYGPVISHLLFTLISGLVHFSFSSSSELLSFLSPYFLSSYLSYSVFWLAKLAQFFPLRLCLILPFILSHLSASLPPPAVVKDDKPPYTVLCAQAALDKNRSVEGVVMGVGAGWGPQRNGFNLNYSS